MFSDQDDGESPAFGQEGPLIIDPHRGLQIGVR